MSQIDTSMSPALRGVMLSEIKSLLPAFLSAASVEREGAVNAAVELLGLPEFELRRILAVHIMLSTPIRELVCELPTAVRRPLTSSVRPRIAGRTVTSGIDWAATARHRATSSPLGDIWVTRPANRIFDIPENRALAWVLRVLEERGIMAVPPTGEAPGAWGDEIRHMTGVVRRTRRTAWLEGVPDTWPGDDAYLRLKADRMGFYRIRVANAARYLRHILIAPSPVDIVQALSERYFEPRQDWKLFEIAVLMRISRDLAEVGKRLSPTRLFQEGRGRPFARFSTGPSREIRLWYQMWPFSTRPSELDDAVRYYGLPSGGNRPDIVIELVEDGKSVRAIVLELKASTSGSYLSSGFSQLLGYLRDRRRLLTKPASGWLVAPPGTGYTSKVPDGRALWVTSSDEVSSAVRAVALSATYAGCA
ncbi:hypothetical protein [Mycolicibacterium sp. 120270]|uniref:hypothetical protein n=1 Tax=Mycolicibacterium sp. 120270 TaxID=3090600 RepID=UPI00299D8EF5|nr:hypothetical protein [Mycolicibacterium sp. 120270]MDX1885365.1 hypothetical protein [Mycolicibacterium sp. 120270]